MTSPQDVQQSPPTLSDLSLLLSQAAPLASQCSSLELTVAARAHHLLRAHQALRLLEQQRKVSLQPQADALCSASSALVAGPSRPDSQPSVEVPPPVVPSSSSISSRASVLLQPTSRRARTKLAQDTQAFSESVATSLRNFEGTWDACMAGATTWHAAERRATGKARQLDGQGQEDERPRHSWLSEVKKGTEEGKSAVELLMRTIKRMLNRPAALASALMELEARSISELTEKLPASSKAEPPIREETPLRVILEFYEAASGALGVLAFAEALLVAATQRLERSQEREVEALILTLLSDLHATGLTMQVELQEGSSAPAAEPLAPSRSLELALLSYLRHSAPSAPPPPRAAPSRIVSTPPPTSEATYTRSRRVSSPGTPAAALGGTLTALGTGAADLWNASLAGGRDGLHTLTEGVSSITAGMSVLFASGASDSTSQSPPSRDKASTPAALHTPRKASSSRSVSNFSTPTLSSAASSASSSTGTTPRLFPRSGLPDLAEDGVAPTAAFTAGEGADARKKLGSLVEGLPPRRRTVSDANSASKVGAPSPSMLGLGHPSSTAASEAPGHAGPPVEAVCEVFRALSGASSSSTDRSTMQTMPLVQFLSRRLLQHHFNASASPTSHRRLTLLILVRWYAFLHLRSLLTKPEASRHLSASPHLRLSRGGASSGTNTQTEPQKMMEGVWTSGDEAQQRLGELHRAVYAAMLRATGMSKPQPKGASASADAEARRLVESFGAQVAGSKASAAHTDRCVEQADGIAVLGLRCGMAAVLLRVAGSVLLCDQRVAESPQLEQSEAPPPLRIDTSSSPNPAGAQPLASVEEVQAAARDLLAAGEAQAMRESTSPALESLAVIYIATRVGGRHVLDRTLAGLEKQLGSSNTAFSRRLALRPTNAGPDTARPAGSGSGIPFPRLVASTANGAVAASGASPTSVGMTQSLTSSTISSSLGHGPTGTSAHPSSESGWGSPPQSPSMRDTFSNELDGLPSFSPDFPVRRSSRKGGPPSAWKGGIDEPEPSVPMLIEADNDEEIHWDEIRRGVLALLRKGYVSADLGRGATLLSVLANGAAQASQRHAFDDAATFTQTHALLTRLTKSSPSMAFGVPSSFGSRTYSNSPPTFGPLLARLAAPLQASESATMSRINVAHSRLAELEVQRCTLIDRARIVYAAIQELRTRVWYACEIRVSPTVIEAREKATAGLLAAQANSAGGESGQEWLKRLAIYDFAVPARIQDYLRDLDGAFGAIAGDTAAFFASHVWIREAELARPFLEGSTEDAEGDAAVLTFGACTTELLQPNEVRSPTRVGLEDFLQRVQLLATGLLLSEAMAGVTAPTPQPVAEAQPHPLADLVKELKQAGARDLLARFELHPAPRTKMRALLVLEKLIVSLLSRTEHARPVACSSTASAVDAGITTPKAASPSRPLASAATRTGYTSLRRPTPARPTIVRRASDQRAAHASTASATPSIDERRLAKAAAPTASPRVPSKARRALSMYDDDSGDESGQEGGDGLDGLPSANGPSIHDLLASMLASPAKSSSKSSPVDGDAVTLRSESPTRGAGNTTYARRPSTSRDVVARKAAPSTPNAAPTTDDVVGVLEALCADSSCRPRDLFLHLQIVAAFTPTSVLDFKDEAYCFWNWGAACLAALPPASAVSDINASQS